MSWVFVTAAGNCHHVLHAVLQCCSGNVMDMVCHV